MLWVEGGALGALWLGNAEGLLTTGWLAVVAPGGRGTPAGPGMGWGTVAGAPWGRGRPAAGVKPLPASGARAGIPAMGALGRGAKGTCSALVAGA